MFFACKIHGSQLEYGNTNYKNIDDTLQINLNNFRCNKDNLLNKFYLANIENSEILTKKFRIDMLDLVLGSKMCCNVNDRLSKWCRLLMTNKKDELYILATYLLGKESGEEFMNEVEMLCSDDEYIGLYTKLSKKELEYNTYIAEAKEEGFNDGKKSGIKNRNIEIAKSMLNEKIDIVTISKITSLSIEEINTLN